jgi:hypothetical protein
MAVDEGFLMEDFSQPGGDLLADVTGRRDFVGGSDLTSGKAAGLVHLQRMGWRLAGSLVVFVQGRHPG